MRSCREQVKPARGAGGQGIVIVCGARHNRPRQDRDIKSTISAQRQGSRWRLVVYPHASLYLLEESPIDWVYRRRSVLSRQCDALR